MTVWGAEFELRVLTGAEEESWQRRRKRDKVMERTQLDRVAFQPEPVVGSRCLKPERTDGEDARLVAGVEPESPNQLAGPDGKNEGCVARDQRGLGARRAFLRVSIVVARSPVETDFLPGGAASRRRRVLDGDRSRSGARGDHELVGQGLGIGLEKIERRARKEARAGRRELGRFQRAHDP